LRLLHAGLVILHHLVVHLLPSMIHPLLMGMGGGWLRLRRGVLGRGGCRLRQTRASEVQGRQAADRAD
jgi:hypothetical protein